MSKIFKSIEICAGAGGQALGLEQAGFHHLALVEIESIACQTLKFNRPEWNVIEKDVREFSAISYQDVDLLAGGVPCPPFSVAGKQLGEKDERDLFPEAIRLAKECLPKAILLENVRGLLSPKFESYRENVQKQIEDLGYLGTWKLLNSSDFGVPQLRPRTIFIALKKKYFKNFQWPERSVEQASTVGELLYKEMKVDGWERAGEWKKQANRIAPTIVGGSKKHGGPDLGPTRAKRAWAELGVDGHGIANDPPQNGFQGMPKLTTSMVALLQGFPKDWKILGKKTPAYRQIGNAFPPPVAKALGTAILTALKES